MTDTTNTNTTDITASVRRRGGRFRYELHPYASVWPQMTPAQFDALCDSIEAYGGLRQPLLLCGGLLVDGRHRQMALIALGLPVESAPVEHITAAEAAAAVLDNNAARRHETTGQKAQTAHFWAAHAEAADLLTQEEAAAVFGIDRADVSRAGSVCAVCHPQTVAPELTEAVRTGAPLRQAAKLATAAPDITIQRQAIAESTSASKPDLPNLRQAAAAGRRAYRRQALTEAAADRPPHPQITHHHCDIRRLAELVEPASIDIIYTDPPYEAAGIGLMLHLRQFAEHALRQGGDLFVLTGTAHLADYMRHLTSGGITYNDTIALVMTTGPQTRLLGRGTRAGWKPLIWLTKPPRTTGGAEIVNAIESSNEHADIRQALHHWGQSAVDAHRMIRPHIERHLLRPAAAGAVRICDPFCGGGATAAGALTAGATAAVIADIDHEALTITRHRLAALTDTGGGASTDRPQETDRPAQ